jgi:BlaI family penicillinase repressor
MARLFRDVTDGEIGVLNVLWEARHATIRQVTDAIHGEGTVAQYATVQKLLEKLEAKGYVQRDRSQRAHVFRVTIERDELIGWGLQELANGLSGGSIASLFAELVKPGRLTANQQESLRVLVGRLERQRKRGRDRGP